jgi:hypothetical protein|tara:strand:+ start:305 stop:481 length:177 start_codon:yes stop_codon:yes gene_type:complete
MSIDDYDTNNQDSQILNGDSVENHQREVDQMLNEMPEVHALDSAPFTGVQLRLEFNEN